MKSKLFIGLLIGVLLMTLFTSCNGTTKSFIECGEEVISFMAEMVENEAYISLYDLPDAYDETISKLREGDYSKSLAVYELSIPAEEMFEVFDAAIKKEHFSEDLYKYVCSSAYVSFASRINQRSGAEAISVSSAFSARKTFASKSIDAYKIYLYVFENGCPIAITFVANSDGSFSAVGHFIINDAFVTNDEYSIQQSCEASGIKDVTVKKQ
ncbi:MAG: hypothetical protein E7589_05955 [Ruminococcaceae bacterium]|nr:hypothetical protein [Oscillospiraceae bacterium]